MKLPPKQRGPLPVSWGEAVEGEYYECCNGAAVVCRPLRTLYEKDRSRPTVITQRKSGPWQVVLRVSGMRLQHREQWYFRKVAKAIEFAEAALPVLLFYDIDPMARLQDLPGNGIPNRAETLRALDTLYRTVQGMVQVQL